MKGIHSHVSHGAMLMLLGAVAAPKFAEAQDSALGALASNATDFNFFWTEVAVRDGALRPERGSTASGVGFELSFEIPRGFVRRKRVPDPKTAPKAPKQIVDTVSCVGRFKANKLYQGQKCADTTYKVLKRSRPHAGSSYEEEPVIDEFDWERENITFEVAVGFTQSGPLVSRDAANELRVSIREAPSVSLYANFSTGVKRLDGYLGARTGLVQLHGGRAYADTVTRPFGGSTFQVGLVGGGVAKIWRFFVFLEGSYTLRDINSIEWDGEGSIGTLPRSANLSGPAVAFGLQFQFKEKDEKK